MAKPFLLSLGFQEPNGIPEILYGPGIDRTAATNAIKAAGASGSIVEGRVIKISGANYISRLNFEKPVTA